LATKDPLLQSLMRRYQKFVPASLPIRKRMSRPVCLFVNFMGTRTENSNSEVPLAKKPCQITAEKDGSNSVSAYPSDIPAGRRPASVRPQKRQKVSRKKDSNPKRNREISPLSHHFDRWKKHPKCIRHRMYYSSFKCCVHGYWNIWKKSKTAPLAVFFIATCTMQRWKMNFLYSVINTTSKFPFWLAHRKDD
jgi:hypothetical protein